MIAWIDARIGVAGDMLLGALVDVGADRTTVREAVLAVSAGEVDLAFSKVTRAGLAATRAQPVFEPAGPHHRGPAQVLDLIGRAGLEAAVAADASAVFMLIAEAEAACHGCDVADVHFHEVGALDTIADVVGVIAAWHDLGAPRATASVVGVGSGLISTHHGSLSVPPPAVTALLAAAGAPSWAGPLTREATTPTGAALVAQLASAWGDQPRLRVRRQGYGAGSADPAGVANVTRVVLGDAVVEPASAPTPGGEPGSTTETIVELRCNVDDLDPRAWPSVIEALLAAGALDAWTEPITMKHGRPAQLLGVLSRPDDAARLREAVFSLTPTFGVRWSNLDREVLDREWTEVEVDGLTIAVKVGRRDGRALTIQPEWRDVEAAAAALALPAREVLARARRAVTGIT